DLVGVDVAAGERDSRAGVDAHRFHDSSSGVAKWPATAVAAATAGETRWVRPPAPCLPSKLRLDVLAQRSCGARVSGFMPRHIEHPALRQSAPAARKTSSSPSCSACAFTSIEPGTTRTLTPS